MKHLHFHKPNTPWKLFLVLPNQITNRAPLLQKNTQPAIQQTPPPTESTINTLRLTPNKTKTKTHTQKENTNTEKKKTFILERDHPYQVKNPPKRKNTKSKPRHTFKRQKRKLSKTKKTLLKSVPDPKTHSRQASSFTFQRKKSQTHKPPYYKSPLSFEQLSLYQRNSKNRNRSAYLKHQVLHNL